MVPLLVLAGCGAQESQGSPTASTQVSASADQSLPDVVSAEGLVVPLRDANLGFKAAGRVQEILVAEGDVVSQGQELAKLETSDLELAVKQAEAGLKSAQAQLMKLQAGARAEEIDAANAVVAIALGDVKAAEGDAQVAAGNISSAAADVEVVKEAVEVAKGNLAAAQATLRSANASLNKLQAGPTDVEISIAEKELERARNELYGLQQQRDAAFSMNEGQIGAAEAGVQIAQLLLEKLKSGTRAEDLEVARAQVTLALAGVQTATAQVRQAESQVKQAEARTQIAAAQQTQADARVESAQAYADQAQAQLDLLLAGARPEDIATAEAAVLQAEATLAEAQNALNDTVLRAPFGGTVGTIFLEAGELVLPQVTVMRLGDLSRLQIETEDLSEVDINQVKVGQPATITVDALGGEVFDGVVSQVAIAAVDRRGDQVYTVSIDLDEAVASGLRWGMTTFVEIDVR
jgi:HlyD family secretion protein